MKAKDVPLNEWFMVLRTKQWFKKREEKKGKILCSQIGTKKTFEVSPDEEVVVRK